MAWIKGQSGNPAGRPRELPIAVMARAHTPKLMARLAKIALDPKTPPAPAVAASQAILDRAYGKAPTFSTNDAEAFRKAVDLSDDQLATIAAQATHLRVVK